MIRINRADLTLAAVIVVVLAGFAISSCDGLVEGNEGPTGTSSGNTRTHRSGQNCANGGCHSNLRYAGTVYTDITGAQRAAGVTIVVTESDGNLITMVSDSNGNFWTENGNPGGEYNATAEGNSVGMVTTQTNGGCSSENCHGSAQPIVYQN